MHEHILLCEAALRCVVRVWRDSTGCFLAPPKTVRRACVPLRRPAVRTPGLRYSAQAQRNRTQNIQAPWRQGAITALRDLPSWRAVRHNAQYAIIKEQPRQRQQPTLGSAGVPGGPLKACSCSAVSVPTRVAQREARKITELNNSVIFRPPAKHARSSREGWVAFRTVAHPEPCVKAGRSFSPRPAGLNAGLPGEKGCRYGQNRAALSPAALTALGNEALARHYS